MNDTTKNLPPIRRDDPLAPRFRQLMKLVRKARAETGGKRGPILKLDSGGVWVLEAALLNALRALQLEDALNARLLREVHARKILRKRKGVQRFRTAFKALGWGTKGQTLKPSLDEKFALEYAYEALTTGTGQVTIALPIGGPDWHESLFHDFDDCPITPKEAVAELTKIFGIKTENACIERLTRGRKRIKALRKRLESKGDPAAKNLPLLKGIPSPTYKKVPSPYSKK